MKLLTKLISAALVIFPVLVLIIMLVPKTTLAVERVICSWNPGEISVNSTATVSFETNLANNPVDLQNYFTVTAEYNDGSRVTVISESITFPPSDTVSFTYNVFNREGLYTVEVFQPDGAHKACGGIGYSDHLVVGNVNPPEFEPPPSPPPAATCPQYINFSPPGNHFTDEQNIGIGFTQVSGKPAGDYELAIFKPGDELGSDRPIKTVRLVQFGSVWVAILGTFPAVTSGSERSYDLVYFYAPNTLPATPPVLCGLIRFFVGEGQKIIGENPCQQGVCSTGLGSLPFNPTGLGNKLLTIAVGLGGGLALILMVIGAIRVLTSQGDQQRLNGGREMIVAAVAGLLFLVFAVIILQFIGVNILGGVPTN